MNSEERPKDRFVKAKMVRGRATAPGICGTPVYNKKNEKKERGFVPRDFQNRFKYGQRDPSYAPPLSNYAASRAQFAASEIQAQWQGYLPAVKLTEEAARFGPL